MDSLQTDNALIETQLIVFTRQKQIIFQMSYIKRNHLIQRFLLSDFSGAYAL